MKRQLISSLLSLTMAVSMMPAVTSPAFAGEGAANGVSDHAGYAVSQEIGEVFDQLEPSADPLRLR